MVNNIYLSILPIAIIILLMLISKPFYDIFSYAVLALLMVSFVGYDPVSILIPVILIIGFAFRHIQIKKLGFPSLLKLYNFIFIAFAVVSFLWDPVWNWVIRFLSGILFFYFLNLHVNSTIKMRHIFFAIILGTVISSLVALSAIAGFWVPGPMFFPMFQDFRFAGLYNTTMLAIFTSILIIWVFDEALKPKLWIKGRFLKVILLAMLFCQLLTTLTRSAWLGLFLGILVYLLIELWNSSLIKRITILSGCLFGSLLICLLVINLEVAEPIRNRISQDTFNVSEEEKKRASFYFTKNALKLAMKHPFGVGIGNTQKNVENFNDLEVGAHNNFVMVMSDMGWYAFVGFLLSQLFILKQLLSHAIKSKEEYGMSAQMLFSCYVVLLAAGMYQDLILYIPMWLIPSLSTIVLYSHRKKTLEEEVSQSLLNSKSIKLISG